MLVYAFLLRVTNGVLRYNDEKLPQPSGIYFENQGPLKIVTSKWDLTAYVDLKQHNKRAILLAGYMTQAEQYCASSLYLNVTDEQCSHTHEIVNQIRIEILHRKDLILNAVGHNRPKRGISFKHIKQAAQILFGLCDAMCIMNSIKHINDIKSTGTKEYKNLEEQTKIIKIENDMMNKNYILPRSDYPNATQVSDALSRKNFMLVSDLQISLLLTQYMIETNTVFEIIQSAKIGQIHPNLLSPEELLEQFKDIKIGLPSGTDFPVEMDLEETTELLKLSDLAIYYAENSIVFKISIPLVYQHTMTLYHLIPKPVCENNNCFYVNPNYKYLAVSRSK